MASREPVSSFFFLSARKIQGPTYSEAANRFPHFLRSFRSLIISHEMADLPLQRVTTYLARSETLDRTDRLHTRLALQHYNFCLYAEMLQRNVEPSVSRWTGAAARYRDTAPVRPDRTRATRQQRRSAQPQESEARDATAPVGAQIPRDRAPAAD
ncbi:hypothetical protein L209DRAFT_748968 [Thermothelomyces heterothallicus CBS 203.75]